MTKKLPSKLFRVEKDSLGEVFVPKNAYWGPQTQRSKQNFDIGQEKMPQELLLALVLIKKAAAKANCTLKVLSKKKMQAISKACDEILSGALVDEFPLSVWQTGSGTQTNMNVNEVIANRAIELLGSKKGDKTVIHANDDVNKSQSTNDVFPTAIHIAALLQIQKKLLPALQNFHSVLRKKSKDFASILKVGRTHLMDAAPLTLGHEFSAYASQIDHGIRALKSTLAFLKELAIGGTAVGTGLNAPKGFTKTVIKEISKETGIHFVPAENPFEALASNDAIISVSGALKRIAAASFKIANDIRWLASGPRCGIGEIFIPENEPGSSIMPGKVNPTQCEAMTQVAIQVMGNDTAIGFAGALGNFELNVFKPLLAYNLLQSINLLTDAITSLNLRCVKGIKPHKKRLKENLERSLMHATALNPAIGYDMASKIVRKAYLEDISLKEAALALGALSSDEFDRIINHQKMVFPHKN